MVKLVEDRFHDACYITQIHQKTGLGIGIALQRDAQAEGMAMYTGIRMPGRRTRSEVRRLEKEFLIDL